MRCRNLLSKGRGLVEFSRVNLQPVLSFSWIRDLFSSLTAEEKHELLVFTDFRLISLLDMGACGSSLTPDEIEARKKAKAIDANMAGNARRDADKVKLLLLGAGESGKSTIFKQMKLIYGAEYTAQERESFATTIYANLNQTVYILVKQMEEFAMKAKFEAIDALKTYEMIVCANQSLEYTKKIDLELGEAIKQIWNDPIIQKVWARRAE